MTVALTWPWLHQYTITDLSSQNKYEQVTERSHLFIHEDIDDGVDHCAGLGQDGGDDTGHWCDQTWGSKCGQQGHDAIRQPAQQVAHDHNHHHEQDTLLSFPSHGGVDATYLKEAKEKR